MKKQEYDLLDEELDELAWQFTRKFMQQIEREVCCQLSAVILLSSTNLIQKWVEYVRTN